MKLPFSAWARTHVTCGFTRAKRSGASRRRSQTRAPRFEQFERRESPGGVVTAAIIGTLADWFPESLTANWWSSELEPTQPGASEPIESSPFEPPPLNVHAITNSKPAAPLIVAPGRTGENGLVNPTTEDPSHYGESLIVAALPKAMDEETSGARVPAAADSTGEAAPLGSSTPSEGGGSSSSPGSSGGDGGAAPSAAPSGQGSHAFDVGDSLPQAAPSEPASKPAAAAPKTSTDSTPSPQSAQPGTGLSPMGATPEIGGSGGGGAMMAMSGGGPLETVTLCSLGMTIGTGADEWRLSEDGGSDPGRGSAATEDAALVLREGNSHLVAIERELDIPAEPAVLEFHYEAAFDSESDTQIKDAFEAALVDAATGEVLAHAFRLERDAFFNDTEDLSSAVGSGTTISTPEANSGKITVDLSEIPEGTAAKLVFRLVNNDGDTGTVVRLFCQRSPNLDAIDDEQLIEGSEISFEADFSDLGGQGPYTATVAWGDGTVEPAVVEASGNTGTVSGTHRYLEDGEYQAIVTITDEDDDSTSTEFAVSVSNAAPLVTVGDPVAAAVNQNVALSATFTDLGTLDVHTATVNWGDGASGSLVVNESNGSGTLAGSHAFTQPGTYNVIVTVDDGDGGVDTATFPVIVSPAVYEVPGAPGTLTILTLAIEALNLEASYRNELGIYIVAANNGSVGGVLPGQSGYAQTALSSLTRQIVFARPAQNSDLIGQVFQIPLPAGTKIAYYLVQNSTTATQLQNNPQNLLSQSPKTFFSNIAASPDGFQHFRHSIGPDGKIVYEVEDLTGGGDQDYNDMMFSVSAETQTVTGPIKFHVVDASADRTYQYNPSGVWVNQPQLESANSDPRGVASNVDGSRRWVVDVDHSVYVYDGDNAPLGAWQATSLSQPEDIATDGTSLWIVDAGLDQVLSFNSAGTQTSGQLAATSSFSLHTLNTTASGLVLCHFCCDGWYPLGRRSRKTDLPGRVSWRSDIE